MVPLDMTEEKAELMTGVLGCKLQGMPFTYLRLPMGTTKPRVEHFAPLMNRVERQLTSISNMLTYAGKLQLVNSVLSSLSTFIMCSISVPVEVHEYVDREEDTTCGEIQRLTLKTNPWWHGKSVQDQREKVDEALSTLEAKMQP
jgi:hypothetical protein